MCQALAAPVGTRQMAVRPACATVPVLAWSLTQSSEGVHASPSVKETLAVAVTHTRSTTVTLSPGAMVNGPASQFCQEPSPTRIRFSQTALDGAAGNSSAPRS